MENNVDEQYLSLIRDIKQNGVYKETRSGEVLSVFGRMLRFNLQEGLPILTTKQVFSKGCIHELLWFLSGSTNIKYLLENNVHIWDDDAYRYYKALVEKHNEILNERLRKTQRFFEEDNLVPFSKEKFLEMVLKGEWTRLYGFDGKYVFGDLGDVYGKQWRDFEGVDQIQNVIDKLKENPDDRRMLCVAYNPSVADKVALPPCHVMFQFYSAPMSHAERLTWLCDHSNGEYDEWKWPLESKLDELGVPKRKLSCMWTQRSVDVGLGLPFNILSYAILTNMIAQCVGMEVGELIGSLCDCHIYLNQMDGLDEQLSRDPHRYKLPKLELNKEITNIDNFKYEDIKIVDYYSIPKINLPLSVG